MTVCRRFVRHRPAMMAAGCLALMGLAALTAPWLSPRSPDAVDPRLMLRPPGVAGWLGTDEIGRDVLSRLLHAGRASLLLGLGVAMVSVSLGGVLGLLAGGLRGWVDAGISAIVDALLSIPALALAMVAAVFLSLTPWRLILVLAFLSWTTVARLVRGQVLTLMEWPFIEAAQALGVSRARILVLHIVPNLLAPVFVAGTLLVANAILVESALSFLGFGIPPPTATWGGMLYSAQIHFVEAPWLGIFPGMVILIAVAGINFLGEGLREAMDPRLR